MNGLRLGSRCSNRCTMLLDATLGFTASENITNSDFETAVKESVFENLPNYPPLGSRRFAYNQTSPNVRFNFTYEISLLSQRPAGWLSINRSPIRFSGRTPTRADSLLVARRLTCIICRFASGFPSNSSPPI